ncbi:hypothetical protein ACFV2H_25095 [Streptomyces sp. NPDC059629]|uniref:hypothetical protein n=1 Tax=Streptomyces sp. NPDC059629 TaxID=3346889 RepID=UPI00367D3749
MRILQPSSRPMSGPVHCTAFWQASTASWLPRATYDDQSPMRMTAMRMTARPAAAVRPAAALAVAFAEAVDDGDGVGSGEIGPLDAGGRG